MTLHNIDEAPITASIGTNPITATIGTNGFDEKTENQRFNISGSHCRQPKR